MKWYDKKPFNERNDPLYGITASQRWKLCKEWIGVNKEVHDDLVSVYSNEAFKARKKKKTKRTP